MAADDHSKTKEPLPQRPRGPHPYRVGGTARAKDDQARALLTDWVGEYAPMVHAVVARAVRPGDADVVEDLVQDVWLEAWQYMLRGNTVARPAGLLATKARRRVAKHYASARVRRELLTDYQDETSAVARLASWIGAAA
ncbi:RNA polymerase sigma factor [Streptomyces mexicanus]|uniref:RNA polymerase sigma factor n=1 Tax=Streptomyces mexicanus TaxID=178566 RepID=UPI0031EB5093